MPHRIIQLNDRILCEYCGIEANFANELCCSDSIDREKLDIETKKIELENKKLEIENKKLDVDREIENKKLDIENKNLENSKIVCK
jgi:hypothetical protein